LAWLSKQEGRQYDLPTKRQFSDWSTIDAEDGHVFTSPVGTFRANGFGLFNMHWNVREWCSDWYAADYYGSLLVSDPTGPLEGSNRVDRVDRVDRGGGWGNDAGYCRSADRSRITAGHQGNNRLGIRVAIDR